MSTPSLRSHPAWFGSVMGTAAMAGVLANEGQTWHLLWIDPIAVAILILGSVLGVVLLPRYVRRIVQIRALQVELSNPATGPMLGTFPAGILLLGINWARVGPMLVGQTLSLWVDAVLLVIGLLMALGMGTWWAANMTHTEHGLASVHGGWLIPTVMNLLVPMAIAPLAVANPEAAPLLLLIGFAFLGIGTFLFLAIFALLVARLTTCEPAPVALAPSLWIPLAPAGLIGLATLRLIQAGNASGLIGNEVVGDETVSLGVAISAMGIGFGLWWAIFTSINLFRIHRSTPLPIHIGWWSFVFPTAAMALSIGAVGLATGLVAVQIVGAIAAVGLVWVWAMVAWWTMRAVYRARA